MMREQLTADSSPTDEEELARKARFRARVVTELAATEETYIEHLELIIKWFMEPLQQNGLLPENALSAVFGNLHAIRSVNQVLMESLQKENVGMAFLELGPFLKLYAAYAKSFQDSASLLQEWEQKSKQFRLFKERQEGRPEVKGLKLNALLITPVQRIPRYKMLLGELLENTPENHDDYSLLKEAVDHISQVALHINENVREHENFIKCLSIQTSLGDDGPKIVAPGRTFVKEGRLLKVSRKKGGRSNERMFFLFSDMLLYAKPRPLSMSEREMFICCCIFPLNHCAVHTVFGEPDSKGALFTISCKGELLFLYSENQEEVRAWIEELQKAISQYKQNRGTLRKDSSCKQPMRRSGIVKARKESLKQQKVLKTAAQVVASEDKPSSPLRDPMRRHLRTLAESTCITPARRFFSPKKPGVGYAASDVAMEMTGKPNLAYQTGLGDADKEEIEKENELDDNDSMEYDATMYHLDLPVSMLPDPLGGASSHHGGQQLSGLSMRRMQVFTDHEQLQLRRQESLMTTYSDHEEAMLCGRGAMPSLPNVKRGSLKMRNSPLDRLPEETSTSSEGGDVPHSYCTIL
ncbi:PREDICTED: rho guanine nucleotide exchange factor 39-like [Priapulus caudatus]|uniref:Rho guanine nucleotide exchange factor 39-like n=1 Tax=Priapulus caudatus TaxID=37621 RepID=A0ABM1EFJ5_PRICU|nr:PREDICTED: rho guanine nucleotide exchange factor 39-like [Priapulus caudatus]